MDIEEIKLNEYIMKEKFNIKLEEVAGLEKEKEYFKQFIINPVKFQKHFKSNTKPLKGILLYGPPGVGKTYLSKAVANEIEGHFFYVSGPMLVSKWLAQSNSGRIIKDIFDYAKRNKPAVICFDEIDFMTNSNNDNDITRIYKQEFLNQMKELENEEGVVILGIAAKPWELDRAVRKCFQKKIYIPLPELNARKIMIHFNLKDFQHNITDEQIEYLAKNTEFFSCSDIYSISQDAYYEPFRKCQKAEYFKKIKGNNSLEWNYTPCQKNESGAIKMKMSEITDPKTILPPKLNFEDFKKVLVRTRPAVGPDDLKKYEKYNEEFNQEE